MLNRFARKSNRTPAQMGKLASMLSLPLMAVVILLASRALSTSAENRTPPEEGVLVVANLAGQSFTIHDLAGTTGTREIAAPGPPHEMVERDGRIYATLGRADLVVELDPRAPGILRTFPLDGEPHGIAIMASELLITLDKIDALARLDVATGNEQERGTTAETPHAVAVSGAVAFVTAARSNTIEAFGGYTASERTGALPESVAVVGAFVVTANAEAGTLGVYDLDSLRPAGAITLNGSPVRVIALDDRRALVALGSTAEVVVVDLNRMRIEHREKVGARPDGLCLSPSREFLAVISNADDLARIYRLPAWTPVMALGTGVGPGACSWLPN